MAYYRFSWEVLLSKDIKDSYATIVRIIKADTKENAFEELRKGLLASGDEMPVNPKIEVITLDQYINDVEKMVHSWFLKFYLYSHYDIDSLNVQEYSKTWRETVNDPEKYLTAMLDAGRLNNLLSLSKRVLDLSKTSVEDFYKFLKEALYQDDKEAFDRLLAEMPHKL